jgi:hypothetical protein
MYGLKLWLMSLLIATTVSAQEKPGNVLPDMAQMQHGDHHGGFMWGGMQHGVKGVTLQAKIDEVAHAITLREGPINLPANTSHMKMPQPPDLHWTIPMNAWLLAYGPRLVDADGNVVSSAVLHHTGLWNENRVDFVCPTKEEHIFAAGSEMTNWIEVPGYGYRVQKGDQIRLETMVHNPTGTSYKNVFLEIHIPYQEADIPGALTRKNYYPAWIDVKSCVYSAYDLEPGKSIKEGVVTMNYSGVLLGVGGHMHDYAKGIVLDNVSRRETVAALDAKVDSRGHLLSMPTALFFFRGGYKVAADDALKISATYDNPTGNVLRDGAMGIIVGYFVPDDDMQMAGLRRNDRQGSHPTRLISHDR